jgi:hypothetical protein
MRSVALASYERDTAFAAGRKMEPVERRPIVRINNVNAACQTFGAHYQRPAFFAGLLHANLESELVAPRAGAFGEVECFAQHGTADLVTQGNHGGIVGARTGSVRVGEIEELAEQVSGPDTCRATCRECHVLLRTGYFRCTLMKAREFETGGDRHGGFIDQMHIKAVKALVGDECCYRAQNLREAVPIAFGRSQGINYTNGPHPAAGPATARRSRPRRTIHGGAIPGRLRS